MSRSWIAGALAGLALLLAPPAHAAEVFRSGGWKGYVAPADEMGGCRMSNRIKRGLHAVAHVTRDGTFLLGFVDSNSHRRPGERMTAQAWFDGDFFPLVGSVDNPQLVTFGTGGGDLSLRRAFRSARRMRLEWPGGWIDMGLAGSSRAYDRLLACASYTLPPAPPVTSYAPAPVEGLMADTDLPGNDYQRIEGVGLAQCVTLCVADGGCGAVTHNGRKGVCFMKYGVGYSTFHAGATSWVK